MSDPLPLLVIDTAWDAGWLPPGSPVNSKFITDKLMVGSPVMFRVMEIVCGLFVASSELMSIVAVYVPADKLAVFREVVNVLGAVVVFNVAESQPLPLP